MPRRILIADDDRVLVEQLSTRLRAVGFEVSVAFDGAQAMMLAVRTQPHLMLLDVKMPAGTGYDTLRRMKSNTATNQIPVILMSALPIGELPIQARELGASQFIRKPASFERYYSRICDVLGITPRAVAA